MSWQDRITVDPKILVGNPFPESVVKFKSKYPEIWKAFAALGEKWHEIGPLDAKRGEALCIRK
jgi:hypothetical protein